MTRQLIAATMMIAIAATPSGVRAQDGDDSRRAQAVSRALEYLSREQRRQGFWEANGGQYRVAMTALATMAMLCEGSTTTRGQYAEQISRAVDYMLDNAQPSGLIGYKDDYRYTYGHGFSMLCLSQVFGEEEDADRRERIRQVLTKAVEFSGYAQTTMGGWGYVSAKDGNDFDEGSTCVTQVQGLRAARNAGIPVSKEVIDRAHTYIEKCMTPEGGIQYSIKRSGGARPPITAAAIASLFSAGEYEGEMVQQMLEYCSQTVWPGGGGLNANFGHWHYAHYYYAQVMYRQGEEQWQKYISDIGPRLVRSQAADGSWKEGSVGPVYTTAINATILQLDNGYMPIYQR